MLSLTVGLMFDSDLVVAEAGTRMQITEVSRGLGGARYWAVMQFRGAATLYQAVFFATLAASLSPVVSRLPAIGWALFAVLSVFLLRASLRMLRTHMSNQTFEIDASRWKLYMLLRSTAAPEHQVACLDITDMQLLPAYASGTAYVGGGEWLQPPQFAIARQDMEFLEQLGRLIGLDVGDRGHCGWLLMPVGSRVAVRGVAPGRAGAPSMPRLPCLGAARKLPGAQARERQMP